MESKRSTLGLMRAVIFLLGASCVSQNVTYTMQHQQAGEVYGICCTPGEQTIAGPHRGCTSDFSFGVFTTYSYGARSRPRPSDHLYDVNETLALLMVAPGPALPGGVPLGTWPWELLYVNPATADCVFGKSTQMWLSCAPPQAELADHFGFSCFVGWHLLGTSWVIQWARVADDGEVAFSNAMDVTIQ